MLSTPLNGLLSGPKAGMALGGENVGIDRMYSPWPSRQGFFACMQNVGRQMFAAN